VTRRSFAFHHQPGRPQVKVAAVLALVAVCAFCLFHFLSHPRRIREDQPEPTAETNSLPLTENSVTAKILPARKPVMAPIVTTPTPAKPPPTEAQIKAAFLVNFLRYSTFPSSAFEDGSSPYLIVAEEPAVYAALKTFRTARINGRPFEIESSYPPGVLDTRPHLVYCTRENSTELPKRFTGAAAVLSVSDAPGFLEHGGMIQLFIKTGGYMAFRVNTAAVAQAGIILSPKLLRLAAPR
jgi:hypothetical protein